MLGSCYEQMGSFKNEGPHGRQRKVQNLGQVREVQKVQRVKEVTVFSQLLIMLGLNRNSKPCKYSYKYTKLERNIDVLQLLPANRNSLHLDSDAGRCQVEKLPYV